VTQAANWVNQNVVQPVVTAVTTAATWVNDHVVQPAVNWVNQNVVQPVVNWLTNAGTQAAQTAQNLYTYGVQAYQDAVQQAEQAGGAAGMNLDDQTIYFSANGKDYRLELWKGSYMSGGAYGGEIGLYYKDPASTSFITQVQSAIPGWYASVLPQDQYG